MFRLEARLARLSFEEMARIARSGCQQSLETLTLAEALLAKHASFPSMTADAVFTTPDLLAHIMSWLTETDFHAASVCSLWQVEWKCGVDKRRRLRRTSCLEERLSIIHSHVKNARFEGEDSDMVHEHEHEQSDCFKSFSVQGIEGGIAGSRFVVLYGDTKFVIERCSEQDYVTLNRFASACEDWVADGHHVYEVDDFIQKIDHTGQLISVFEDNERDCSFCSPVLSRDGCVLFCVCWDALNLYIDSHPVSPTDDRNSDSSDEIIAIDTTDMTCIRTFGKNTLHDARGITLLGDLLYVCDLGRNCLWVFTTMGDCVQTIICNALIRPFDVCGVDDRLYVIEHSMFNNKFVSTTDVCHGQRIFVFSREGELLYVHEEPGIFFQGLACYEDKLIANYSRSAISISDEGIVAFVGVATIKKLS